MRIFPGCRPSRLFGLVALAVLLPVLGCGKSTATVTGSVSYKGTKLKGGQVIFQTADGKGATGNINEDGTYTAEKVPTGVVKVAVKTAYLKPPGGGGPGGGGGGPPKNEPPPGVKMPEGYKPSNPADNSKLYTAIPEKYEDPEKSGLTMEVKGGTQTKDWTLD